MNKLHYINDYPIVLCIFQAALKVNHPWGYGDLVSLEVREEDLISRVEKEISSKVKTTKCRTQDVSHNLF